MGHDFTNAGKNLGQYHWVKKVTTRTISLNTCSNFVPDEKDLSSRGFVWRIETRVLLTDAQLVM